MRTEVKKSMNVLFGARCAALLGIAVVAFLLTGCGRGDDPETSGKMYIPVISKGFQHQYWQAVKKGAEEAAEKYDVVISFEGPESEWQVDKQIEMLQAALGKNPAAICFAALDSNAAVPLLEKARERNIPVVGFDSGVNSDVPVATAATKNLDAAALAADKMAERINNEGKIAVIVHDQTSRTGIDRRDGFVNRIKDTYGDISIVAVQYGDGDQLKSTDLAKAIMQANPDLKGFFGANEGSAVGILNAAMELNRKDLVIIGFDAGKHQKIAVKNGLMAGAITQNPVGIGFKAVEAAVKAARGEQVEPNIDTGFFWYDKSNIDDEKFIPLLYD